MRLSIAVPIYINHSAPLTHRLDRQDLLVKCLDSVIRSANECEELISIFVIDDKSNFELSEFLPTRILDNVTIVRNEGTKGQSGALNYYLSIARTMFVATTDSDCIVAKDWVSCILAELSKVNGLGLCGPNWYHQLPACLYGKILTKAESFIMRHYFLARVSTSREYSSRFDCRNFVINIERFEQIAKSRKFFVESVGPSVSGISSHLIREIYLTDERMMYRYSERLRTYHEPITSLKTQIYTYYKRGREGVYNKVYRGKEKTIFISFFNKYLYQHFLWPIRNNPTFIIYIIIVHSAYWYGIFCKEFEEFNSP